MRIRIKGLTIFSRFVLTGIIVFVVIGVVLSSLVKPVLIRLTFQQKEADTLVFVNRLASDFLLSEDFKKPLTIESRERFERFGRNLPIPGLFRVKIWNPQGVVIYSDRAELLGDRNPNQEAFERALQLKATVALENFDQQNPRYQKEQPFEESILTHAPITFGASGEAVGVVETLSRFGFLKQQIDEIRILFTLRIALSLLIMFAALSFIVFRASRTVDKQKKELLENLSRNEAILSSMGDGLVVTDLKGKVTIMNRAAEEMTGWTEKEVLGKNWLEFQKLVGEDEAVPPEKRPLQKALSTGKKFTENKYYYVHKDGSKFPTAITASPVILDRKVAGGISVFRDITEEKEIDRAKSEFVSLASHQLRTPLSSINWYTEMLSDDKAGKLNEKQKGYLSQIYESSKRMVSLVNDLLNVSRLELGTLSVMPTPTHLPEIIESILKELTPDAKIKKLALEKKYALNLPKLNLDPKIMRIVFQNLLSNAVLYTPSGKVSITMKKEKENILIEIADTGYGIPKDEQAKIFTKLFRADNIKDKNTTGSGLGLYVVKTIIEQFGGRIWFKSPLSTSKENPGTAFYIELPLTGMKAKGGATSITLS